MTGDWWPGSWLVGVAPLGPALKTGIPPPPISVSVDSARVMGSMFVSVESRGVKVPLE